MSLHRKLIDQARLLAPHCCGDSRHVSFLIRRNRIVSIGLNSFKLHRIAMNSGYGYKKASIHSELSAIVNAGRGVDLSRLSLYNVMVRASGIVKLSKPCEACQRLIAAYDIRRVFYTTNEGFFERY